MIDVETPFPFLQTHSENDNKAILFPNYAMVLGKPHTPGGMRFSSEGFPNSHRGKGQTPVGFPKTTDGFCNTLNESNFTRPDWN